MSSLQMMRRGLMAAISDALPSIMQIDGGTFTLSEDMMTGTYTITHSLGVVPDAVFIFSQVPLVTEEAGSNGAVVWSGFVENPSASLYRALKTNTRAGATPQGNAVSNGPGIVPANVTATDFGVTCNSTAGLRGGVPYYWIAVKTL